MKYIIAICVASVVMFLIHSINFPFGITSQDVFNGTILTLLILGQLK